MSKKWDRRENLIGHLKENGEMTINDLALLFDTSTSTIRRDLTYLEREDIVIRTHGGVLLDKGFTQLVKMFDERMRIQKEEKLRIAQKVVDSIEEYSSIILDNGSTSYYIAKLLSKKRGITIATSSLAIASAFGEADDINLMIAGGDYRYRNNDCIGQKTIEFFQNMYFDYCILNCDLIIPGNGFFKMSCKSSDVSKAMKNAARNIFVAADYTKLDGKGNFKCVDDKEVNTLFIDLNITDQSEDLLKSMSYDIVFC